MADVLLTPGSWLGLPRCTPKGIHHAGRDTVLERTTRGGRRARWPGTGGRSAIVGAPRIPLLGLCSHVSIVIKTYTSIETGERDLDNRRAPEHIGEKQGNSLEARRTERGQRDRDR
jgi:hypothetical protein